ncbi:uncharacterized protein BJ171DRAFT_506787 [Polychytrium aggregatum]|uniref:uncharacterized protein n=1 Tax=Polychytrium aggregatum TaxID=110093 RepID=UPI0022FE3970|nr:uncharacterized protein BJ171DRAFT_506787 [Polychytrium aggregatum]KAI9204257.1 hypothetical protein BJ171DRAFT_506787 [Polychytrium aggregatum]
MPPPSFDPDLDSFYVFKQLGERLLDIARRAKKETIIDTSYFMCFYGEWHHETLFELLLERLDVIQPIQRWRIMILLDYVCDRTTLFKSHIAENFEELFRLTIPSNDVSSNGVRFVKKILKKWAKEGFVPTKSVTAAEERLEPFQGVIDEQGVAAERRSSDPHHDPNVVMGLHVKKIQDKIETEREQHKRNREAYWLQSTNDIDMRNSSGHAIEFSRLWQTLPDLDQRDLCDLLHEHQTWLMDTCGEDEWDRFVERDWESAPADPLVASHPYDYHAGVHGEGGYPDNSIHGLEPPYAAAPDEHARSSLGYAGYSEPPLDAHPSGYRSDRDYEQPQGQAPPSSQQQSGYQHHDSSKYDEQYSAYYQQQQRQRHPGSQHPHESQHDYHYQHQAAPDYHGSRQSSQGYGSYPSYERSSTRAEK